jgi:hypothetical protein
MYTLLVIDLAKEITNFCKITFLERSPFFQSIYTINVSKDLLILHKFKLEYKKKKIKEVNNKLE